MMSNNAADTKIGGYKGDKYKAKKVHLLIFISPTARSPYFKTVLSSVV